MFSKPEEEQITTATVQEIATVETEEEEIEEEEEQFQMPEPEEVVAPEEVANQQQVTDLLIVEDEKIEEDKQVKNQEDVLNNEAAVGAVDITEGTNDLNKIIVKEEGYRSTQGRGRTAYEHRHGRAETRIQRW